MDEVLGLELAEVSCIFFGRIEEVGTHDRNSMRICWPFCPQPCRNHPFIDLGDYLVRFRTKKFVKHELILLSNNSSFFCSRLSFHLLVNLAAGSFIGVGNVPFLQFKEEHMNTCKEFLAAICFRTLLRQLLGKSFDVGFAGNTSCLVPAAFCVESNRQLLCLDKACLSLFEVS